MADSGNIIPFKEVFACLICSGWAILLMLGYSWSSSVVLGHTLEEVSKVPPPLKIFTTANLPDLHLRCWANSILHLADSANS